MARRSNQSASRSVELWVEKASKRSLAIFRDSAQRLGEEANKPEAQGGKLPVDTGFLRNSFVASMTGMPNTQSLPLPLVLLSVQLGDTVYVGWTAKYARRLEYGFDGADKLGRNYSQAGKGFLRAAVQKWPQIVNESARAVKNRIR